MTRHSAPDAHGVARRYAVLAAVTVLGSFAFVGLPGRALAQTTSPAPSPTDTAAAHSVAPTTTSSAPATQPADTTAPTPAATTTSPDPVSTMVPPAAAPTSAAPTTAAPSTAAPSTAPPAPLLAAPGPGLPTKAARLSPLANGFTTPHGPYGTKDTDSCALCHRAHTAQAENLLSTASPQSALCFSCHDGTGASTHVAQDFTTPGTTNVLATTDLSADEPAITTGTVSNYYRHDATVASAHTLDNEPELAGQLNRHSECSDCHDPHQSQAADVTAPAAGAAWPISSRLSGVSGVSVVNGGTAAAPTQTYTFLEGTTAKVTAEYQLCFKCHSGYTTQKSNTGVSPMAWALDAGLEFNTVNNSFHPVEGPGTNQTQKMTDSLSNNATWNQDNPYKITTWTFTTGDTVRCTQCHANGASLTTTTPETADLAPHVSTNRGILLQPYRDRALKQQGEAYSDGEFALCYMCHTNYPFRNDTSTATNFGEHFKHVAGIPDTGSRGLNIDKPGDGQGNALCSECHYRLHSTATTTAKNARLVTFAPDVQPYPLSGGVIRWTQTSEGHGTCTLTCHGKGHNAKSY